MSDFMLWIHSARQIVQVVNNGQKVLKGKSMSTVVTIEKDPEKVEGLSILIDFKGNISFIGTDSEVKTFLGERQCERQISAQGQCIIPGLVDAHTHSVWEGDRVHEFAMKLAGATYLEVHEAGGGIHYTVDHVRKASEDQLYDNFCGHARKMMQAGTTLLECKSGYGLEVNSEMKMLHVLERARKDPTIPLQISATYCGAHAVPKGSTAEEATEDVISVQLPRLQQLMTSGELTVDNIDVFCEKGVFDVKQTRRILEEGKKLGLAINFHGEELSRLNSAEMGAELEARAISHLEEVSDAGIKAMSAAGTVAVVLPSTAYILRLQPPPVRKMLDEGMAVALGSDFNPNAHCFAMPTIMHLGCVLLRMSMAEALVACTINAAASLGKSDSHGSLEVGKRADLLILNAPRWEHLIYQLGSHQHIIDQVIIAGNTII